MKANQFEVCSCFDCGCFARGKDSTSNAKTSSRLKKTLVMYAVMVAVSTTAIFFLEHSSLVNAFRTALVAAVGKTIAANWVSGLFE